MDSATEDAVSLIFPEPVFDPSMAAEEIVSATFLEPSLT